MEFKSRVIKKVGCIPIYWKPPNSSNNLVDLCKTQKQFKEVYQLIKDPVRIMKQYDPPCEEMQIPVTVQELDMNGRKHRFLTMKIVIRYSTEIYQEISNFRDYNLDTLWSSVGGFIGIFLGYSLLQLPELLQIDWKNYWNMMFGKRNSNPRLGLLLHRRS